jgi:pimeloyl-ACP methyl ester carboxylesterase
MQLRRFDLGTVQLEAWVAGPASGELVLLLHGFPESGDAWRRQIPALAGAGLRVVAPHQRGYAGSSKPAGLLPYRLSAVAQDMLDLADALQAPRFSVVGHDWGAAVGWHLATVQPDRVQRLVILNGPHAGTVGWYAMQHPSQYLRSWYVGAFQLPGVPEALLRANHFALLKRAMRGTARPGAIADELLDRYAVQWAQPGALTAMLNWYRALALDLPTPMLRVDLPVTVLWGERDPALDRGLADAALALCNRGRLVTFPQATHWLHHEEPEPVAQALVEALT